MPADDEKDRANGELAAVKAAADFDARCQAEKTDEHFPHEQSIAAKLAMLDELPEGVSAPFSAEEYAQVGFIETALTREDIDFLAEDET